MRLNLQEEEIFLQSMALQNQDNITPKILKKKKKINHGIKSQNVQNAERSNTGSLLLNCLSSFDL